MVRSLADRTFQLSLERQVNLGVRVGPEVQPGLRVRGFGPSFDRPLRRPTVQGRLAPLPGEGDPAVLEGHGQVVIRVERFDRRGTESFEPFEPFEFFQNRNFPEFFLRKFKNFRKFQHFLNYRRNSDKISSKSEQKSVKRIQK